MREDFALLTSISDINEESSIQIWGVGNPLLGDDAVGGLVASRLGGVDCGVAPENYISKLRKNAPEFLFIIDASDFGGKPGAIKIFNFERLSGTIFSSHGVPLKMLLEPFAQNTKIYLIAIQPLNLELGDAISAPVNEAADVIAQFFTSLAHHAKFSPR